MCGTPHFSSSCKKSCFHESRSKLIYSYFTLNAFCLSYARHFEQCVYTVSISLGSYGRTFPSFSVTVCFVLVCLLLLLLFSWGRGCLFVGCFLFVLCLFVCWFLFFLSVFCVIISYIHFPLTKIRLSKCRSVLLSSFSFFLLFFCIRDRSSFWWVCFLRSLSLIAECLSGTNTFVFFVCFFTDHTWCLY